MRSEMYTEEPTTQLRLASQTRVVSAFGESRSIEAWSRALGVSPKTLRRRLRSMPPEVALSVPRWARVDGKAPPGAPCAWTWERLAFEDDPWAQRFVAEHPSGATLEDVGAALGIATASVKEVEDSALDKLRAAGETALLRQLFREHLNVEDEP